MAHLPPIAEHSFLFRWLSGKKSACQCRRHRFNPWSRKIHWRRKWLPTPVFLPGKSHGSGAWWTTVHRITKSWTWLSDWAYQDSSLENPMDWETWQAIAHGIAKSWTWLGRLNNNKFCLAHRKPSDQACLWMAAGKKTLTHHLWSLDKRRTFLQWLITFLLYLLIFPLFVP